MSGQGRVLRIFSALIIGVFLLSGCRHAPIQKVKMEFFYTKLPTRSYIELGRVSVQRFGGIGKAAAEAKMLNKLAIQAKKMGADALVNITEDFASMSGVAVQWKDEDGANP